MNDTTTCAFDFITISKTLRIMAIQIKNDIRVWHKVHLTGNATLVHMLDIQMQIIKVKQRAKTTRTATPRQINFTKEKINKLRYNLIKPYELLENRLHEIAEANRRIRRMLGQVNIWMEVHALHDFIFADSFKLQQMQDFLVFLIARLEAEYEIKDMVLDNLLIIKTKRDIEMLLYSWQATRHALTQEFYEVVAKFESFTLGLMYYI